MPNTYASLHYHLVFSTKNREPCITNDWKPRLHDYLGGTVNGLDGTIHAVGGIADHVHLLVGLKPTHNLADFMRDLKKDSTRWVKDTLRQRSFGWQEGYAAFSISSTALEAVRGYVLNQEEHHRVRSFREELVALLERTGVVYDERYLD